MGHGGAEHGLDGLEALLDLGALLLGAHKGEVHALARAARVVPGVRGDLVALLDDALLGICHAGDLLADLEEGRVGAVLFEDVEDLAGGRGPGTVVEGEGDDLLVADIGVVGAVAGVGRLLGDLLDGLARDLAGPDGLLAVLAGREHVDRAVVVAAQRGIVPAALAVGDRLGGLGVLLVDVGAVVDLELIAGREAMAAVGLGAVDGRGVGDPAALLGNRAVDGDEVAGGRGDEPLVHDVLHGRAGLDGLLGPVDAHLVERRVEIEIDSCAHRGEDEHAGQCNRPAALLARPARRLVGVGRRGVRLLPVLLSVGRRCIGRAFKETLLRLGAVAGAELLGRAPSGLGRRRAGLAEMLGHDYQSSVLPQLVVRPSV